MKSIAIAQPTSVLTRLAFDMLSVRHRASVSLCVLGEESQEDQDSIICRLCRDQNSCLAEMLV